MSQRFETRRVLIILHQDHSSPGRLGQLLQVQGFVLDIRRPRFGDPLPQTLHGHAGAIVFGGPMSANDEEEWLRAEIDWLKVPLKEGKPLLGICLGAQMLARHLGHRVYPHPEGRVELGYYPVEPTEAGRNLCASPFPDKVYQWHKEGFDLPCGATLLARGEHFEAQAFRYGAKAYGFQFHPEVTYAMMCRWTLQGTPNMDMPGAQPRHRHLEGWYLHDSATERWISAFLALWIGSETALAFAEMGAAPI